MESVTAQSPSQEKKQIITIMPQEYSFKWWQNIVQDKKNLEKNLSKIIERAESQTAQLQGKNKSKAASTVNDIKLNFSSYLKVTEQPLQDKPLPTPIAERYSLDKLIALNTRYAAEALKLEGRKDELEELNQVIRNLQDRIDLVRQKYQASQERSAEKIVASLEMISLFPKLEIAEKKKELLQRTIENEEQIFKYLEEEISAARTRLYSDLAELRQLARELDPKMFAWQEAKQQRQQKELALTKQFSQKPTEEAKRLNENLQQKIIAANLEEIAAQNAFIQAEIMFAVSKVLVDPKKVDIETLSTSLRDWNTQLSTFLPQLKEWQSQTERVVTRDAQLLSLQKNDKKPNGEEILKSTVELGQKNLLQIQGLKSEIEESLFLHSVAKRKIADFQGTRVHWLSLVRDFFTTSFSDIKKELGTALFYIGSHPVTPGALMQFLLIMFFTWWIAKFLTAFLDTVARKRKGIRKAVIYRVNTLFRYFLLLLGFLVALTSIGFDLSNLALIAGALGIGIGFGLQNIFKDFISGIIILFQSQLKVGDFIVLDMGLRGEIREINVRSTVITTNDGVDVIVPNSEMLSSRIINWTLRDPYRRLHVPFGVAYGSDIDKVSKIVIQAAKEVPSTLDKIGVPEPQVFMKGFGESALEMELVVWVDEKWTRRHRKTTSLYLWAIEKALKKEAITIPFPQRDLHIKTDNQH